MTGKLARTHTHVSNRAKARDDLERKTVFKSVLDNPFRIQWPSVPMNVQNSALAYLVTILDGVSDFQRDRAIGNRKRKRMKREELKQTVGDQGHRKKRKVLSELEGRGIVEHQGCGEAHVPIGTELPVEAVRDVHPSAPKSPASEEGCDSEPPAILRHLTVGINQVTKSLESQIRLSRQTVRVSDKGPVTQDFTSRPSIKTIFVCRADVDPPLLIAHLPQLVATWNTCVKTRPSSDASLDPIKLVPLPKGAEISLATALGLRRVAVLALNGTIPELGTLDRLLDSVSIITASWSLPPSAAENALVPTHIKQVRTSAPKDMKAAKEERVKRRIERKEKKGNPQTSKKAITTTR